MQKAAFSIEKYQFVKVLIDLNNHQSSEITVDFETKGVYHQEMATFELDFTFHAFNEENKDKPFVMVECIGTFKFEEVSTFEEIPDFFYRNCIAILFPFVRAYVSIITSQANVPGIMLPTMNLTSLETGLRQNTTQK